MDVNVWSHKYVTKEWRADKMQGMFAVIPFSNYQFDALHGIYHKCILYIQVIWNVAASVV